MVNKTLYNQHREAFFRLCDAVGENQVEQVRSLLEATPLLLTLRRYNMDDGVAEAKKRLAVLVIECLVDHACSLLVVAAPSSGGE